MVDAQQHPSPPTVVAKTIITFIAPHRSAGQQVSGVSGSWLGSVGVALLHMSLIFLFPGPAEYSQHAPLLKQQSGRGPEPTCEASGGLGLEKASVLPTLCHGSVLWPEQSQVVRVRLRWGCDTQRSEELRPPSAT